MGSAFEFVADPLEERCLFVSVVLSFRFVGTVAALTPRSTSWADVSEKYVENGGDFVKRVLVSFKSHVPTVSVVYGEECDPSSLVYC